MRSPFRVELRISLSSLAIIVLLGLSPRPVWGLALTGATPFTETLPAPQFHGNSFELVTNSRYSVHAGFSAPLPKQVLANVLWAMARVPQFGSYRELFVALPDNLYRYQPLTNTLRRHKPDDQRYNSGSAFEVGIAVERHEECGMLVQAGLLAATAFWTKEGGTVVSCPVKWAAAHANRDWHPEHPIRMVTVFGNAEALGLDTLLVARSSDLSLPDPHVDGADTLESVLAGLRQDSVFDPTALSLETISQLLWAGYGVTPRLTIAAQPGLTVPDALGSYFLAGKVYLVRAEGVDRFLSRQPPEGRLVSPDHRLERLVTGDRRAELTQASNRIPAAAPAYFVVCVADTGSAPALQEAGAVVFQLLAQAQALGLAGFVTLPLTRSERRAIAASLSLPDNNVPVLVFACGAPARPVSAAAPDNVQVVRGPPAVRSGILRVEYSLRRAGPVRAEMFDLLGRPVKLLFEENQSAGYHSVTWDGTDAQGRPVKRGSYILVISSAGSTAQHKVAWAR